jgi:hypothetical protein
MRSGTAKYALLFVLLMFIAMHAIAVTPGRITVVSSPSYAKVCVDEGRCDRTPADFSVEGNSWYTVTVTAAGYQSWTRMVFVTAGQASLVSADLASNTPKDGVQVFVDPGGGTVCLDDSRCQDTTETTGGNGSTLFAGVSEGFHTVKVNNTDGFRTYTMVRYVTAKGISFYITLDPVSPESPETGTLRLLVDHTGSTICIDNTTCHADVKGAYGSRTGATDFSGVTAGVPHTISVVADGYDPWIANLSISPAQINTLQVVLRPAVIKSLPPPAVKEPAPRPTRGELPPGRLTVASLPPNAKTCVDTTSCDTTPADFRVSGNAWHSITVTLSGYQAWSGSAYVVAGQATLINAKLQPASPVPALLVSVNPGGGLVCLDETRCQAAAGSAEGTSFPRVSEGFHTIRVNTTAGYHTFSVRRYVKAEGITAVFINLEPVSPLLPETGVVRVSVNRYGSTICIDSGTCHTNVGGTWGPGPGSTVFTNITSDSTHTITVTADGFESWSSNVSISPDQLNEVRVSLRPLAAGPPLQPVMPLPTFLQPQSMLPPGLLTIDSKPAYAHVCVDGGKCGTTPFEVVVAGNREHSVNVTRSGYLDWSDTILVQSGETAFVNASLQPDTGINGILVFVNPGGGTVCLDDRLCHSGVGMAGSNGSTQFTELDEGYHVITVNNTAGYQKYSIRPYIPRRGFASITISLEPVGVTSAPPPLTPAGVATVPSTPEGVSPTPMLLHGKLRVYVNPIGGTVCIDNGDCRAGVGGAPGPGTGFEDFSAVSAGISHTVSVTAEGFLPASKKVTVNPDKTSSVTFVLQPAPVTTAAPTPVPEAVPLPTKSGPGSIVVLCILAAVAGYALLRRGRT